MNKSCWSLQMNEGYLILASAVEDPTQIDILSRSIRKLDHQRPIFVVTRDSTLKNFRATTDILVLDTGGEDQVVDYFQSLLLTPLDKTIALHADQILTNFNLSTWEALNTMAPVVIPNKKLNFSGDSIMPDAYWRDSIEQKIFKHSSVINAVYLNQSMGASDILQLAIDLSKSYNYQDIILWAKDFSESNSLFLPPFPEFLWEQWVFSFLRSVFNERIKTFDFMNCIDLSLQENNHWNPNWSSAPWHTFLTSWVTDKGDIKIENFVQQGLVRYQHADWLSKENIDLLKAAYDLN